MSRRPSPLSPKDKLNKIAPGAAEVSLGQIIEDLITSHNKLRTDYTAGRTQLIAAEADNAALRTQVAALVVDITALRTNQAAIVVDIGALVTTGTTLATKLNADAGVTDTNYAAPSAATAAAPSALTATAPAAVTAASPAAVTAAAVTTLALR